jgi:hypothetical protein
VRGASTAPRLRRATLRLNRTPLSEDSDGHSPARAPSAEALAAPIGAASPTFGLVQAPLRTADAFDYLEGARGVTR